jgi:hypothetical protein
VSGQAFWRRDDIAILNSDDALSLGGKIGLSFGDDLPLKVDQVGVRMLFPK